MMFYKMPTREQAEAELKKQNVRFNLAQVAAMIDPSKVYLNKDSIPKSSKKAAALQALAAQAGNQDNRSGGGGPAR